MRCRLATLQRDCLHETLFNVAGDVTESRARAMSLICITAYAVSLPLSLVGRVQYAYQQVTRSNLWQMAGAVSWVRDGTRFHILKDVGRYSRRC